MIKLHALKPAQGAVKKKKRIGRGQGSGYGGTSTKGHKGAKSRSGYKSKRGFEGGQTPLQRRLPTFGFKNVNRVFYRPINLDILQTLIDKTKTERIDHEFLVIHGLASKNRKYKILGNGELSSKIEILAHAFSASAVKSIENIGGKVTLLK